MERAPKIIIENFKTLAQIKSESDTPAKTFAHFVEAVGYAAAVETIAAAVRCKSWDGRISHKNAEWADSTTTEGGEGVVIFGIDEIHPAHLDQIANAARKSAPEDFTPAEAPAAVESGAEATEEEEGRKMITYRLNEDKNGIEVITLEKPAAAIREELKKAGFRWGRGYWYAKQTPERIALAARLADGVQTTAQNATRGAKSPKGTPQNRIKVYYNGLRLDGAHTLVKCYYYRDRETNAVTICARDYENLPRDLFEVKNDTDIYTDYFDSDSATVDQAHPLYKYVFYACMKAESISAKKHIEWMQKQTRADRYAADIERSRATIAEFEAMTDPGQPTAEELAAIDAARIEAENARREAEHRAELEEREKVLAERRAGFEYINRIADAHPIEEGAPVVEIPFSENPAFYSFMVEDSTATTLHPDGRKTVEVIAKMPRCRLSVAAADIVLEHFDTDRAAENAAEGHGGYDKTDFIITWTDPDTGEANRYEGRYDLGDNEGGLIAHIKAWAEYRSRNPFGKSAEENAADIEFINNLISVLEAAKAAPEQETDTDNAEELPEGIYYTGTHKDEDGREWFTINGDQSYPLDEWTPAEAIADYISPEGIMEREIATRRAWGFYD